MVKYLLSLLFIASISFNTFAQTVGELDHFGSESLEIQNEVKLYPNPTIDYLHVRINNSSLKEVKFTVHNIIGNIVEAEVTKIDDNNFKIKVDELPSGYYLLAIKGDHSQFQETYKFLKR